MLFLEDWFLGQCVHTTVRIRKSKLKSISMEENRENDDPVEPSHDGENGSSMPQEEDNDPWQPSNDGEDGSSMPQEEEEQGGGLVVEEEDGSGSPRVSKSAKKKLMKLQRYEAKKAHRRAIAKQSKQEHMERKRQEWADKLAALPEDERSSLVQAKLDTRKERMAERNQEREHTREKLRNAMQCGQNIVVDLEFCELMNPNEINSLVQQIMYCYAGNRKSASPAHLWLTGCKGEIMSRMQKVPGFHNWLVEKEERSYIEALHERKEDLVYLTADSEDVLQELEASKIYVVGGLVDRNRWKGITMQKAQEQGIQTAKLPIAEHLSMTSSQVLTVNQVFEILITFLEFKDWRRSLLKVIPQRKRPEIDSNDLHLTNERKKMSSGNENGEVSPCDSNVGSISNEQREEVS